MNKDKSFVTKLESIDCYSYELAESGDLKPRLHLEIFYKGKRLYVIEAAPGSAFVADSDVIRISTILIKEKQNE